MSETETSPGYVWRPWKVVGMVAACLLVVAGGVLALTDGENEAVITEGVSSAGGEGSNSTGERVSIPGARGLGSGLPPISTPDVVPGETPAPETPTGGESVDVENAWSPALLRGGLSFLVGFAVAYAARAFLKIAIFFLGVWAASLFLLSSLGWIEVHWSLIDVAFEGWSSHVGAQFESVKTFITGSLPSAGMAGLGLVTGIRRK